MERREAKMQVNIKRMVEVYDLALELFDNDTSKATDWFYNKQEVCMGASPVELCLTGEADVLEDWLKERLGYKSGAFF